MKNLSFLFFLAFLVLPSYLLLTGCQSQTADNNREAEAPSFFTIPFAEIIQSKSETDVSAIAESVEINQL